VEGSTQSSDFPLQNPVQSTLTSGTSCISPPCADAFVARLNLHASGRAALLFSTYLGGGDTDFGQGLAVDGAGNMYLTGQTYSTDFPTTPGALQGSNGGWYDAFIAKISGPPLNLGRAGMPTARTDLGAALGPDTLIYAIGGKNSGSAALTTVEAYNPVSNTWTVITATLPTARSGLGLATGADGLLYAIGGKNGGGTALTTVEAYNPVSVTWTAITATLPTARANLAVVAANDGRIYALGGFTTSGTALSTVEAYNPVSLTWTTVASLPTARVRAVSTIVMCCPSSQRPKTHRAGLPKLANHSEREPRGTASRPQIRRNHPGVDHVD